MDHVPPQQQHDADDAGGHADRALTRFAFPLACVLLAVAFVALGVWQVDRRTWKLDLIQRVEARVHAAPQPVPSASQWSKVNAPDDEYRRVRVQGVLLNEHETLVQAVTELGPGWWVMTPLQTQSGILFVNRGYVPPERRDPGTRRLGSPDGPVSITGLIRMSEPHGGFLRANDPQNGRWYSRDVTAIARARHLEAAPFFIDAGATPNAGGYPMGGLTVISFRNTHLAYALTWFGLSGLSLAGGFLVIRGRPNR